MEAHIFLINNPCKISQLKSVPFGNINENVSGYGNHNYALSKI